MSIPSAHASAPEQIRPRQAPLRCGGRIGPACTGVPRRGQTFLPGRLRARIFRRDHPALIQIETVVQALRVSRYSFRTRVTGPGSLIAIVTSIL